MFIFLLLIRIVFNQKTFSENMSPRLGRYLLYAPLELVHVLFAVHMHVSHSSRLLLCKRFCVGFSFAQDVQDMHIVIVRIMILLAVVTKTNKRKTNCDFYYVLAGLRGIHLRIIIDAVPYRLRGTLTSSCITIIILVYILYMTAICIRSVVCQPNICTTKTSSARRISVFVR